MREAVRPEIAEMALTASFLASEGLALTADAHVLFVDAMSELACGAISGDGRYRMESGDRADMVKLSRFTQMRPGRLE